MFILITFCVSHTIFVNVKCHEVKYLPSQNNILRKVFSETVDLKTLTHLGNAFPNHAIEIHYERTQDKPPQISNQYMNWLRANPNFQTEAHRPLGRSGENLETATTSSPTSTTVTTTTTSTSMSTTTMSDLLTSRPTENTIITDNRKRPLYMEDLIQALEDFDKKSKQDNFTTSNRIDSTTDEDPNRPLVKQDLWDLEDIIYCQERQCNDGGIKDFNDVIKLLNKGVKVQLEVTTPPAGVDSNLTWVPIKIPKE
ncbi:uncharacterized protein LOC134797269 isoform X2 [Cydia splendana]|uniref:uncharacterized protein LOC134797269 isoform X2 n=1 Tax=Cydia splendana TaxID=1100963 RepID=UPI0028F49754